MSIQRREYFRRLIDLDERTFIDAVDEIVLTDEWFPTVARIREMAKVVQERRKLSITGGGTVYDEIERIKTTPTTWRVPRTADGRVDLEALYWESRRLRYEAGETELDGSPLDPAVDKRPAAVPGWKSLRTMLEGAVA